VHSFDLSHRLEFATRRSRARAVGGAAALLLASTAWAASHEPNIDLTTTSAESPSQSVAAIEQLRLSDTLANFGERNADPVALIEAAKIRKMLPSSLTPPTDAGPGTRTWQSLLARATQYSGGSPALRGLIADVRRYKQREIPSLSDDVHLLHNRIKQKSADRTEVRFKAGEVAVVYLHADSDADLVLFVYDEFNNLICSGESASQETFCRWRPRWDGVYLLDVHNETNTDVEYQLAINRQLVAH
jgi:hypothetical protein